jgi:hypothetical protein
MDPNTTLRETLKAARSMPRAWLTALPPLIIGLLIVSMALAGVPLNRLVIGGATPFRPLRLGVWHLIPAALGLLLIGGTLWGLVKGLPRWSYAWIYAVIVLVSFALTALGEDRPALVSPPVDALIAVAILCALAAVALLAAQRSQSDALIAGIGFSAAFALVSYSAVTVAPFNRLDLALLALPAGLVFSSLIAVAGRGQAAAQWTALVLTIILNIGLMWIYSHALPANWAVSAARFAIAVLRFALAGLVIPPLLAWVWQRRRPALAH